MTQIPLDRGQVKKRTAISWALVHCIPFLALVTGVTRRAIILGVVLYVVRMFFVTAGYHCYFAHRAYRLHRAAQFLFAFGGLTAAQKGPLWWAGIHRLHHRHPDTPEDAHTPLHGFWWSHMGWLVSDRYDATDERVMADFAKYAELRWLNAHDWVGPVPLAVACWLLAGWSGLIIGFFASTLLLWHATFTVNSVAHLWGRRRYETNDTSRNNAFVAALTLGGGWHNNHHNYPASARHGYRWWELDITFQVLRLLAWLHVITDLRQPPAAATATPPTKAAHTPTAP